jgi:hypothetical protein
MKIVAALALMLVTLLAGCTIFTPSRPALEFSPAALPDATAGTAYTADIVVSQTATPVGGASVQDGSLPTGVDLALVDGTPNTVRISGTPKAAGVFTFTVSVWCYGTNVSGQTGTQQYVLIVK